MSRVAVEGRFSQLLRKLAKLVQADSVQNGRNSWILVNDTRE